MIFLIFGIIIIYIILFFIIKDINKVLKIISTTSILSGYIFIFGSVIVKSIINNRVNLINISKITDILFDRFLEKGLILLLIGGIELIIYVLVRSMIIIRKKAL